jgi:hypothetical protein
MRGHTLNMVDTRQWWQFGVYTNYPSLTFLANVLGIASSKTRYDEAMFRLAYDPDNDIYSHCYYCHKECSGSGADIQRSHTATK